MIRRSIGDVLTLWAGIAFNHEAMAGRANGFTKREHAARADTLRRCIADLRQIQRKPRSTKP